VFAPIFAIFSVLFLASTLPNGIRLVELPAEENSVQIIVGYTSGGLGGFVSIPAGKSLLRDAYAAGARIEFINAADRSGVRITAPKWALPLLADRLPAVFKDFPKRLEGTSPPLDFRGKVEEEIRNALMGPAERPANYPTSDAFIVISAPAPKTLQDELSAIPRRIGADDSSETVNRLPAERTLRFKSELPEGAVIFASPIPGAHYREWYSMLLLDRLIRRIVPIQLKTNLPLTAHPYYYRVEATVPAGQFPEPVEERLMQELQRLQFTPASARDLAAAQQDAIAYLETKPVREWFASYDMLAGRDEGMQWIRSMSADDMRAAARDILIMNRVVATWAPKAKQTLVSSEPLSAGPSDLARAGGSRSPEVKADSAVDRTEVSAFPPHKDEATSTPLAERLISGVSVVASSSTAVLVSGGSFTRFDREFTPDDLKAFQQYRPDRILVLAPVSSLDQARQVWNAFKGNPNGETGVPKGKVSSGDLPALFILKTFLDLKVIEAGWSRDVSIGIEAGEGSDLQIQAPEEKRAQVLEWIKEFIASGMPDTYFTWLREVAIHRFDLVRADLQALTWERDPQGTIQALDTIPLKLVQDVARIYF
jgi:hypothetical protein